MKVTSRKILICIISTIALIIAFAGCRIGKTVDLGQYIVYDFQGYDGIGKLKYSFDYEKLIKDLNESNIRFDEENIIGAIELSVDKNNELSNGDKICFKLEVDKQFEESVRAKLTYDAKEVIVAGLEKLKDFDPFEYLKVTFTGISPDGSVTLENTGSSPIHDLRFYVSSDNEGQYLKNGDTITVTAVYGYGGDLNQACIEAGFRLKSNKKDYAVQGLEEYATSLNQISDKMFEELKKQGEDVFKAKTSWGKTEKILAVDCVGSYFIALKEGTRSSYGQNNNYIYIVYKISVKNSKETLSYYYYVRFTDIVVKPDGTNEIYDINNVDVPEGMKVFGVVTGDVVEGKGGYYVGYKTIEELYNTKVRPMSQYYKCEDNIQQTPAT